MSSSEYLKEYRKRRKEAGGCVACKAQAAPGKAMCEKHLAFARARSQKNKGTHTPRPRSPCKRCGRGTTKALCRNCSASIGAKKRSRAEGGNPDLASVLYDLDAILDEVKL